MKSSEQFERELPSRCLSLVCGIIGIIHFWHSAWKADWVLFGLIALCFLPWMSYVFESIGGDKWGVKFLKPIQGETQTPPTPPPITAAAPTCAHSISHSFDAMSWQEKKVLATAALNNGFAVLTPEGFSMCQSQDSTVSGWNDTYDNFSN